MRAEPRRPVSGQRPPRPGRTAAARAVNAGNADLGALQRKADVATGDGTVAALQRQADRFAQPVAQRAGRFAGRAPIQRVLDHTAPLAAPDIAGVTQLAPKVWRLNGHGPDSVIIKIEALGNAETPEQFKTRAAYTTELAHLVLQGVPQASELSPADTAIITGLNPAAAGMADAAGLQGFLNAPHGLVFFKAETVNVGSNVRELIDTANADFKKSLKAGTKSMGVLQSRLMTGPMMRSMGRQAAFDMIVNNYDRFRPDGTVNLTNLDISDTVALGIDNINPWDPLTDKWEGAPHLQSEANARKFCNQIVDCIAEQTGYGKNTALLKQAFSGDFIDAARTISRQKMAFQVRAMDPALAPARRDVILIFVQRLNAILRG